MSRTDFEVKYKSLLRKLIEVTIVGHANLVPEQFDWETTEGLTHIENTLVRLVGMCSRENGIKADLLTEIQGMVAGYFNGDEDEDE